MAAYAEQMPTMMHNIYPPHYSMEGHWYPQQPMAHYYHHQKHYSPGYGGQKPRGNGKRYRSYRSRPGSPKSKSWWSSDTSSLSSSDSSSYDSSPSPPRPSPYNNHRRNNKGKGRKVHTWFNKEPVQKMQDQYVALDCEMVGTGTGGHNSALARVTIINWYGDILLDEYVKQEQEVTDYRTFVSGVTSEILDKKARLDLATVRHLVLNILEDKILVGHGLSNDLKALGISHPWFMTRDTANYRPYMKSPFGDNVLWPRSLKELSNDVLKRGIQEYGKPHSSFEDAQAAMDLYKTARFHWEKSIAHQVETTRAMEYQRFQEQQYYAAIAAHYPMY